MSKSAKGKRATVRQMQPTYPSVRCDQCRTVYTLDLPNQSGFYFITGSCPKCRSERFSTIIEASAEITQD